MRCPTDDPQHPRDPVGVAWVVSAFLSLALLLTACGGASPATVPIPAPTRTTTPTAPAPRATPIARATPSPPATVTPAPTATAEPAARGAGMVRVAPGRPVRIRIPSIGVDASIEHVGNDAAGRMDVPRELTNVAWYAPGARPGDRGNAAISGHLDDYRQQPAVFWRLGELVVGDLIEVEDEFGNRRTFEVLGQEIYPFDHAPLARIFGPDDDADLNLITCNGVWDSGAANYDRRRVIFSRLVRP